MLQRTSFLQGIGGLLFSLTLHLDPALATPGISDPLVLGIETPAETPGPPHPSCPPTASNNQRQTILSVARCEAAKNTIPAKLVEAVIEIESGFNPAAIGKDGERGLMQVMPATARLLGFLGDIDDLHDIATNIRLGVRYLAQAYRLADRDICTTLMKYRAGHGETRFSLLSTQYCSRARTVLARLGHVGDMAIPAPTFGFNAPNQVGDAPPRLSRWANARRLALTGACIRFNLAAGPRYLTCLVPGPGAARQAKAAATRIVPSP